MKFDRNLAILLAICIAVALLAAYMASQKAQQPNGATPPIQGQPQDANNNTNGKNQPRNGSAAIANPASVYCVQHGGISKIITAADGSQSGICIFPDGTQCDEWAYFRSECPPGAATPVSNKTGGGIVQSNGGGPPSANLTPFDNMTNKTNFTITPPPDWNTTIIPQPGNMSALVDSDFIPVDDSLPGLLANTKPLDMPPPPSN